MFCDKPICGMQEAPWTHDIFTVLAVFCLFCTLLVGGCRKQKVACYHAKGYEGMCRDGYFFGGGEIPRFSLETFPGFYLIWLLSFLAFWPLASWCVGPFWPLASWLFGLSAFGFGLFGFWLLALLVCGFGFPHTSQVSVDGGGCAPPTPLRYRAVVWLCDDLKRQAKKILNETQ